MSTSINQVTLLGNVGRDPEVRYTQDGTAVANFTLATNETWKDKDGQKQERTEWHRVEVWGPIAQVVKEHVAKGRQLLIQGSVRYEKWDKDGQTQYSTKIRVSGPGSRLVLLARGGNGGSAPAEAPSASGAEPTEDVPF